jgi:hypothetical protein
MMEWEVRGPNDVKKCIEKAPIRMRIASRRESVRKSGAMRAKKTERDLNGEWGWVS